jgi:hypothetical protein
MSKINQSPAVLIMHASELIHDIIEDRLCANEAMHSGWLKRAREWSKDHGAYVNREQGDPSEEFVDDV